MKLKVWEAALLTAVAVSLLAGASLVRGQRQLSDKMIRIHVVANSDSDEDQALKLDVRDRVLEELEILLEDVSDRDGAITVIDGNIELLTAAASEVVYANGQNYPVSVTLGEEEYPTREYDTFTLPAGLYESLRVQFGDGDGKNWWCVVFPPLCADSYTDATAALEALSDDEIALIVEGSDGYTVKFKALEWLQKLRQMFDGE